MESANLDVVLADLQRQHDLDQQRINGSTPFESTGVRRYVINHTHSSYRYMRPRITDTDPQLLMRRRVGSSNQHNYYYITSNMVLFDTAKRTTSGALRVRIPGDSETLHFVRIANFPQLCDKLYKLWGNAARTEATAANTGVDQRFYLTVHCDPHIEFMLDPVDIGTHAKIVNTITLHYMANPPANRSQSVIDLTQSRFSDTISREDLEMHKARQAFERGMAARVVQQQLHPATGPSRTPNRAPQPQRQLAQQQPAVSRPSQPRPGPSGTGQVSQQQQQQAPQATPFRSLNLEQLRQRRKQQLQSQPINRTEDRQH